MSKHVILYLAANPAGLPQLRLGDEENAIRKVLNQGRQRDYFQFETRWAVQPLDFVAEMRRLRPSVVHFSGHATSEGIVFEDADHLVHCVSNEALARAFELLGDSVRVVVLNACYTDQTAEVLGRHVECVIGMHGPVEDREAQAFSVGFYGGLADGDSVQDAYRRAQAAAMVERGEDVSRIRTRENALLHLPIDGPPPVGPRSIRQPSAFPGTTLGASIVELLQKVPGAASYAERTKMIPPLSRPDGGSVIFDRNQHSPRIDFELIVAQLENLGLPLVEEMLRTCASRVDPASTVRGLLMDAAREVRVHLDGHRRAVTGTKPARDTDAPFTLSIEGMSPQDLMPLDHLFEGNNASPPVRWCHAPAGTESFVLLMEDLDRNGDEPRFYWVQHSIPGDVTALPRDAGAVQGALLGVGVPGYADAEAIGVPGYHGPKSTTVPHQYRVRVIALSRNDVPEGRLLSGAALLDWIEARNCTLGESEVVIRGMSPFANKDFLFKGHRVLGRIFGGRPPIVFALFSCLAILLLVIPARLVHLDDLPANGWTTAGGTYTGPPPSNNRGFFYQPNWWPVYVFAVPLFFASAAWLAVQIRNAVQRIARRPGGVIIGMQERPFVLFVQSKMENSGRRALQCALIVGIMVTAVDTAPLIAAYATGDYADLRPYWGIAHLHAKHVDFVWNVIFDFVAYSFEGMFVSLFAFVTFRFFLFLQILSRTIRGGYNELGYVFAPRWRDPMRRLGLGALGGPYTAFIALSLAVTLFAFLHRIQLLSEAGTGWPGYWSDLTKLFQGDWFRVRELGRWSAVSTGLIAMLLALVIPAGVIAYFPLHQLHRFIQRQIDDENDVHQLKVSLAKTDAERGELVSRHEALKTTNVWPNGDDAAYVSMSVWMVLFCSAVYPPFLLLGASIIGAGGVFTWFRRAFFPRAVS